MDRSLRDAEKTISALEEGKRAFDANLQMNECPSCGAYRLDGRPPLIHEHGCPYEADAPLLYLPDGTPLHR